MTFPFPFVVPSNVVRLTHIAQTVDTSDASTYTFASHSLGTAASNRKILVGVAFAAVGGTVSTLTVAGVSASSLLAYSPGNSKLAFYIATVPTGSTGDIVVTLSASGVRCVINVWSVTDVSDIAHATATTSSSPGDVSIAAVTNGAIAAISYDSNTGTVSWSGLTERADAQAETQTFSSASSEFSSASSPTITITGPGGTVSIGASVSLKPA